MKSAGVAVLALLPVLAARAADFERIEVRVEEDTYYVHASAEVEAGFDAVRAVITDYEHLHWITGAVLKSDELERPEPDIHIIFVRSRACFAIFCKTMEQVQRVDEREADRIVFESLPQQSDVKRGHSEWQLQRIGERRTRIVWNMLMEPDFWVPWLIGPGMIRDGLAGEGRDMINGIEKLAREREERR